MRIASHFTRRVGPVWLACSVLSFLSLVSSAMDAVFPAAGSPVFFPELLIEGYPPHMPREIWCSLTMQPNVTMDITETWPIKIDALLHHKTQIGEVDKLLERMKSRHTEDSTDEDPRYEEKFRVVKYG